MTSTPSIHSRLSAAIRSVGLLLAALTSVAVARLVLRSAEGRSVRWALTPGGRTDPAPSHHALLDAMAAAVTHIGTFRLVRATCLEQALALVLLLRIAGYRTRVTVGVSRAGSGFSAHAWVECGGRTILCGGAPSTGLTPLPIPLACHG